MHCLHSISPLAGGGLPMTETGVDYFIAVSVDEVSVGLRTVMVAATLRRKMRYS